MKKIIGFFVEQIALIITFLCVGGFIYMLYNISDNTTNPIVFYNEQNIENYQIVIDLNTGSFDIDEVLKLEVKSLINDEIIIKTDSVFENTLLTSVILTIILDVISVISSIIAYMISLIKDIKYKKILAENGVITGDELYELPNYEPIIAEAIYSKKYRYELIVRRFKYYYRSIGILNKLDKLKEDVDFNLNSLTEIESFVFNSKICEMTEFVENLSKHHQRDIEAEKKIFRGLVNKKLIESGFYFEDIVKQKVNAFIKIVKRTERDNSSKFDSNSCSKNLLIFLTLLIVFAISDIAKLVIFILGCLIATKYFGLTLSQEGKVERAKIHFLIKHLKRKKDLSEEEKYFLIMLTK